MTRTGLLVFACLLVAACQSTPLEPIIETGAPRSPEELGPDVPEEEPIGTVTVRASSLNVRRGPSTTDEVIDKVRRGTKLALLREEGGWSRVLLADGTIGWVSTSYVRRAKNCPPDRNFRFATAPTPAFAESDAHGTVTVEVTVNISGTVVKAEVTGNSTGDPALAEIAKNEIRNTRFDPPIRDCRPRDFIYVYRRTF